MLSLKYLSYSSVVIINKQLKLFIKVQVVKQGHFDAIVICIKILASVL